MISVQKTVAANLFTIFDDGRTVLNNETQLGEDGGDSGRDGTDSASNVDNEAIFR